MRKHETSTTAVGLTILVVGMTAAMAQGATLYVDADDPLCGTQGAPYCSIIEAIENVDTNDTILVSPGYYVGPIEFFNQYGTSATEFILKSTDGPAVTTIDRGTTGNKTAVKIDKDQTNATILEGFTITGGTVSGIVIDASPIIRNCIVTDNSFKSAGVSKGGGIRIVHGSPRIENCVIYNNHAEAGGGVYFHGDRGATLTIVDCVIEDNTAADEGGGSDGGGVYLAGIEFTANIYNTVFRGNHADSDGGGIAYDPPLRRGGCIRPMEPPKTVNMMNCLFAGNHADGFGGGVMLGVGFDVDIVNCTFTDGNDADKGGALALDCSIVNLGNSILWGDTATTAGAELANTGGDLHIYYSDVQGLDGENQGIYTESNAVVDWENNDNNNIDDDPEFLSSSCFWLSTSASSPAIDVGCNDLILADLVDLDGDSNTSETVWYDITGNTRRIDDTGTTDGECDEAPRVDMGAYEYNSSTESLLCSGG